MKQEFLYNNKIFKDRRRDLRNNSTEEEKILWSSIKNKQINGLRFVRQYGVGPYILDFYCPKLRLGIELDGFQHREKEAVLYDRERSLYLNTLDIKVLRFWNHEIKENIDNVSDRIIRKLDDLPS